MKQTGLGLTAAEQKELMSDESVSKEKFMEALSSKLLNAIAEKSLTILANQFFDEVDTEMKGELGFDQRVAICEKLQQKLNLKENAFEA